MYINKKNDIVEVYFSYDQFEIEEYYMKDNDFRGYLNYSGKGFFIYGDSNVLFNTEKEIIKITAKIPKDIISIYEPQNYILKIHNSRFEIKERN